MKNEATVLFTPRSKNVQTGDIPAAWVGSSIEEMRSTCENSGCPYFAGKDVAGSICRCYAWQGHARQALYSIIKAAKRNPQRYELAQALQNRIRSARILRFSAVGDPSAVSPETMRVILETCAAEGITPMGYVAGWKQAPWWKGILRASCATPEDMEEALASGWKTTRVAPMDARKRPEPIGIMCPVKMGAAMTCNECQLCLYEKAGKGTPDVIWFPDHTPLVKAHRALKAKREAKALLQGG